MARISVAALALLLSLVSASVLARGGVEDLSRESDFLGRVSKGAWFIQFLRLNCAHCEKVKYLWDELGRTYQGDTRIGKVDIATPIGQELARKYEVEGTPTFLLFKDGVVYSYDGPRDKIQSFIDFINGEYHPLWRFVNKPMWPLVWVPALLILMMCYFALRAKPYDGVEDFATQIGAYTPPPDREALDSLVSKGQTLTRRNV